MPGTPVFRLAGTAAAGTSSVSCIWPSHATNDIGFLLIQTEAEATTLVTAGAWVEVSNSPQTTGTAAATNAVMLKVFWARATSGAMPNVSINDAGDHVFAQIVTFTNCAASGNPWNITSGNVKAAASTNIAVTGGTTTKNLALIVDCIAGTLDSATAQASTMANAGLASYAEITDVASTSGGGGQLYAGAGGLAAAGAIPQTTVTLASSSKNAWLRVALIGDDWTGSGGVAVPNPALSGTGTHTEFFTGSGGISTLPALDGTAIQHRIVLALSTNIAADGATATTARLTAPSGKTSGADFQAGTIQDDRARSPSVNLTAGKYTEFEWCLKVNFPAVDTDVYEFRVRQMIQQETVPITYLATDLNLYSVTPQWTVGATADHTGDGDASALPGLSGTGALIYTGTGGVTVTLSLAAIGTQVLTGTGDAAVTLVLVAAGTGGFIGSGALTTAPSLSASAVQVLTGTGDTTPVPALAGTAVQVLMGTGSVTPIPALAASGQNGTGTTGSGNVAVAPTLAATGIHTQIVSGSGSVTPIPALAATATQTLTGTGTVLVSPALAGTATQVLTGSGGVALGLTLSGTGTSGLVMTGTGAVSITLTLNASGTQVLTGSGSVTPARTLSGSGAEIYTGTGGIAAAPVLAATGTVTNLITGTVQVSLGLAGTGTTGARIVLALSANIAASGATATTARLVAPAGKTSGANFQAGKISDDTNPLTLDLTSARYTELEWCLKAPAGFVSSGESYEFRVTVAGTPVGLTSVTPQVTLAQQAVGAVTPVLALAGAGTQTTIGTGSVAVAPALAASGSTNTVGSGATVIAVPALAASGAVIAPITGTGSVEVPLPLINFGDNLNIALPVLAGAGTAGFIGSVAVQVPALALAAVGTSGATGEATVTVAPALAAVGTVEEAGTYAGSGAPTIAPSLAGTAEMSYTGSGACAVPLELSGFSVAAYTGTGDVAPSLVVAADGAQTQIVLAGDASVTITAPQLGGTATVTGFYTGVGAMAARFRVRSGGYITCRRAGKYEPEHQSAFDDVGDVDGFSEEHDSARRDVEAAGI